MSWLRSRQSRRIARANARLQLPIPEQALTNRELVIERLLRDPTLRDQVAAIATHEGVSQDEVLTRARRYAREMGPRFSVLFYFRIGYWLARTMVRLHHRARTVHADEPAMANISNGATVVLVSNHRSSLDPLVITYLASHRSTLALSAGEWARLWPLYHLVRAAGGYVVDRDPADPLYRQVLGAYVRTAAAAGIHHLFFPEGELTRDGTMQSPRLGFLNYFCRALGPNRDIVFIPVGINYDRVPEDRQLASSAQGFENAKKTFLIGSSLRHVGAVVKHLFSKGKRRFGFACVAFGRPLSLKDWLREQGIAEADLDTQERYAWLPALSSELMRRVGRLIPAPPAVIAAYAMCEDPQRSQWNLADLRERAGPIIRALIQKGAHPYLPGGDGVALAGTLEFLAQHGFVRPAGGDRFAIVPAQLPVLRTYANSIAHLIS